jgi:integrase
VQMHTGSGPEATGRGQSADDLVFSPSRRRLRDPDALSHSFRCLVMAAWLPTIRFHDLRYTQASLILARGRTNPKVGQERLRHASVAITLDLYSHVIADLQTEAAVQIRAALPTRWRL